MDPGRPRRGPKRSVDRRAVLAAALELVDDGGLAALTMRALATQVGLSPGALYTYFPDRAAIVTGLIDLLLAEADTSLLARPDRPWRERLTAFALELRSVLLRHPGAVPAILSGPFSGPVSLEVGEHMLAALADAGLNPHEAARASYAVMVYVLGAIALDAAEIDPTRPDMPESERVRSRHTALASTIDPETLPRTHEVTDTIASYVSVDQFRWGLERLLAGLTPT